MATSTHARDQQLTLPSEAFKIPVFMILIILGLIGIGLGLSQTPVRAWTMILTANFFFLCLGIFGTFLLAITYIVKASYVIPFRRLLEAMAQTVPFFGILIFTILLGNTVLYEWTDPYKIANDPILQTKLAYLNLPFFGIRMLLGVAIFSLISAILVFYSRKQDTQSEEEAILTEDRLHKISAVSMIFLALNLTMVTFDWIMSIQSHWYSTIYGVLVFSGFMSYGLAFSILLLIYLQKKGLLIHSMTEHHYHDLGKLLFAFSTFWAYIWYSQYLLIWYANIPEAAEYFYLRTKYGWDWLVYLAIAACWVAPFLILLSRGAKRAKSLLIVTSVIVILGQLLNLYVMVAPKIFYIHQQEKVFGLIEILIPLAYLGLFLWIFFKALQKAPLLPKKSPYFEEGLSLHQ